MAKTFKSNTYEGRYLSVTLTEAVDPTTNTSPVTWVLSSIGGNDNYYTISATKLVINGVTVYDKDKTSWSDKVFPAAKGSVSGTVPIVHDSNGKKTIKIEFVTSVYVGYPMDYGGEMVLTDIDRTPPTVSCSVSNITSNGMKISATSSVTADIWEYSLDGGKTWTQFSTTAATTAAVSLSALKANTEYAVKCRARKKSNHVYGTSAQVDVKTLGASTIDKTYDFAVDVASPVLKFQLTVFDASFYHLLTVKAGARQLFQVSLGRLSAGTSDRTHQLTAAQRTAVLDALYNVKSASLNILVSTFADSGYSNRVGGDSYKAARATTSAEVSGPVFGEFHYADVNDSVVSVTGDDQVLVQGLSELEIICHGCTAKNGASIKSHSVSIGNLSKTSTTPTFSAGIVTSCGDLLLTVTCTDSRGYSATQEKTIKVIEYEKPRIYSFTLRRRNEIEGLVQLSFAGNRSTIKADGETDTNALTAVRYRYKKTNADDFGEFVSIIDEVTGSEASFAFASLELLELDPESSYDFQLQIRDRFGEATSLDEDAVLPQGTPLIALRKRNATYDFPRVGINNPSPTEALDVVGNIKVSGDIIINGKRLSELLGL